MITMVKPVHPSQTQTLPSPSSHCRPLMTSENARRTHTDTQTAGMKSEERKAGGDKYKREDVCVKHDAEFVKGIFEAGVKGYWKLQV